MAGPYVPPTGQVHLSTALDQLIAGLPQVAPTTQDTSSGGGLLGDIGSVFKGALPFAAKNFTWGFSKVLAGLDLSRQYISKPIGGAMLYMSNPSQFNKQYGGFSYNNLRTAWDESNIPAPLKFGMEMALDPTNYIGLGLGKTTSARFAEEMLPMALRSGPVEVAKNFAARQGLMTAFDASPEASRAIKAFSTGGVPAIEDVKAFLKIGGVQGISEDVLNFHAGAMLSGDSSALKSLRGGLLQRYLPQNRATRVIGQVDMLADSMWGGAMSIPGTVIARVPINQNMVRVAVNTAGQMAPIKQTIGLMSFFGPDEGRIMYDFAKQGHLGSWLLAPSTASAERDLSHTIGGLKAALNYNEVNGTGHTVIQVLEDARNGDGAILDKIPFAHSASNGLDEKRLISGLVAKETDLGDGLKVGMSNDTFANLISSSKNLTEDGFWTKIRDLARPVRFGEMGVMPDPQGLSHNMFQQSWGFVGKAIDKVWRPLATTFNPSFTMLNYIDNMIMRGGGFGHLMDRTGYTKYLQDLGVPQELLDPGLKSASSTLKTALGDAWAMVRHNDILPGGRLTVEQATNAENVTQLGIATGNIAQRVPFANVFDAAVRQTDSAAQLGALMKGTAGGILRRIHNDPNWAGQASLIDEISQMTINPAIKSWVMDHVGYMQTDPQGFAKAMEEKLNLTNIHAGEVEAMIGGLLSPEDKLRFVGLMHDEIQKGTPVASAALKASQDARSGLPNMIARGRAAGISEHQNVEKALSDVMDSFGIGFRTIEQTPEGVIWKPALNLSQRRQIAADRISGVVNAAADALSKPIGLMNEAEGHVLSDVMDNASMKAFRDSARTLPEAAQATDHLIITQMSHVASENGMLSASVLPAYFNWDLQMVDNIAARQATASGLVSNFGRHITIANQGGALAEKATAWAKEDIGKLALLSGDHQHLMAMIDAGQMPTETDVAKSFASSIQNTFQRYLGAKLNFGDGLVDAMAHAKIDPMELASLGKKTELEIFQNGNLAQARLDWADRMASKYDALNKPFPKVQPDRSADIANLEKMQNDTLTSVPPTGDPQLDFQRRRVMKDIIQGNPTTEDTAMIRQQLMEDPAMKPQFDAIKLLEDKLAHPPTQDGVNFFTNMENYYNKAGAYMHDTIMRRAPEYQAAFLKGQFHKLDQDILKMGINTQADLEGIAALTTKLNALLEMAPKGAEKMAFQKLSREAMLNEGMSEFGNMMVDYTKNNNLQRVLSTVLPFASFQMHLPGFLGRTFVKRPGLIVAMNHFVQEAKDKGVLNGGMMIGGGFVFAPQLRQSWLPIMNGQNFVNADNSLQNQVNDMLSLFGFSPGPNVQLATDIFSQFAHQANIPGMNNGDPQLKYGIVPEMRFVQDITGLAGINGGKGISLPFFGATADVRQRQVQKELANQVAIQINDTRYKLGRDLTPEEVADIRTAAYTGDSLKAAQQKVNAMDLTSGLLADVKTYSPTEGEVLDRVANWLSKNGQPGTTRDDVRTNVQNLNGAQKTALFQSVPEYQDFLAIPPFTQSEDAQALGEARKSYFDTIAAVTLTEHTTQVSLDKALDSGAIDIPTWRSMRSDSRSKTSQMIAGIKQDPNFAPVIAAEKVSPTDPGDQAYQTYNSIQPQDFNGDGLVGQDDMNQFYALRTQYMNSLPQSIQTYIHIRQQGAMTPHEKEFVQAQDQLNQMMNIPKWAGMDKATADIAEPVLKDVQALARLQPGQDSTVQLIMTMPGLTNQERMAALQANAAPLNPMRFDYYNNHPLMQKWYPDYAPTPPSF